MTTPKMRVEINTVLLSGTICSDLNIWRVNENRHPIVSFDAETVQTVGVENKLEVVKWRGKCFGVMAERASQDLRKGLRITIEGSFSGFERPERQKAPRPELTVKKYWLEHPMEVAVSVDLAERTPEERKKELDAGGTP
jgi:single-stranded DNA-binding protein